MKRILLTLAILGLGVCARADQPLPHSKDAKMKALLTGTWTEDCGNHRTFVFQSDGTWLIGDLTEKWDIQGGKLIEIRPEPEAAVDFAILFLTKDEFLARENSHGQAYIFLNKRYVSP